MTLKSKVVLVAGGTGGLGCAVSRAVLEQGSKVFGAYRRAQEFQALTKMAGENASRLVGQNVDVTDETAVRQFVQGIVAEHGRLDFLVNAVGAYVGGVKLWELDTRVFDQMLTLNLRSGFVLSLAVVPVMLKQGSGAIVNVAGWRSCLRSFKSRGSRDDG